MLLDDFSCPDLRCFMEGDRFFIPRCSNHSWTIFIFIAFGSRHCIADTVDEPDVDIQPLCHLDGSCLIRDEFGLCRHDHELFDKRGFTSADGTNYPEINIAACSFGNIFKNIYLFQVIPS
ncbi:Uncharacterised protein [Mycobacteroides abscessus subsp. abscessus]|nr:Uncharacterised protein [Mycobacteroides abscessus subsp. abscessus]